MVSLFGLALPIILGGNIMEQLKKIAEELHKLYVERSKLAWVQYTVGYDFGLEACYKKINDFMQNKEYFEMIKAYREKTLSPEDKRRVDIMYKSFESHHQSSEINELKMSIQSKTTELSKILNTFRYRIDGKEKTSVELAQILSLSEDRELRKKAYLAKNQINKPMVEAGFVELIHMRKKLATLSGYESFVALKLDDENLEPSLFDTWKDEVNALLPEMNAMRLEYARKYLNDDIIYPWDESFVAGKIAPSLSKKVDMLEYYAPIANIFKSFGFDLDDYNITYDIYSRKNKSEWGYNFPIETGVDSRILANVKDKFYEFGVLLHETGHGVHSFLKDPKEVILNYGISGIVTEGIANLFGALMLDENFYNQFFDEDLDKARDEFRAIKAWRKMNALRAVSRIMFDQELYRSEVNDLEDIYDIYWRMDKEYLGLERQAYEPPCLFVIHHTTHPIYYHNYLMGDVTCEMLAEVFKKEHGVEAITDKPKAFGDFLFKEVIEPSGLYTYGELFKKISGKPFSLNYMK